MAEVIMKSPQLKRELKLNEEREREKEGGR